jgi:hypothetical protein
MRQYTSDFEPVAPHSFDDLWEKKLTSVQQVKGETGQPFKLQYQVLEHSDAASFYYIKITRRSQLNFYCIQNLARACRNVY